MHFTLKVLDEESTSLSRTDTLSLVLLITVCGPDSNDHNDLTLRSSESARIIVAGFESLLRASCRAFAPGPSSPSSRAMISISATSCCAVCRGGPLGRCAFGSGSHSNKACRVSIFFRCCCKCDETNLRKTSSCSLGLLLPDPYRWLWYWLRTRSKRSRIARCGPNDARDTSTGFIASDGEHPELTIGQLTSIETR